MAIMMITHDLGVIAETARRVVVMYAGKVMEVGDGDGRLQGRAPSVHHRAQGVDPAAGRQGIPGSSVIPGKVPDPLEYPAGCRFSDRCKFAEYRCDNEAVDLSNITETTRAALLEGRVR